MWLDSKRLRGAALRLALRRPVAVVAGLLLVVQALILMLFDFAWETWATDGLGLVVGATGAALLLAGFGGRRPDWIDES